MLINATSSLSHIKSYEDPSISSHLETIHVETKNLPKLKYSLACIANSLTYNNSNRHYNIAAVSKQNNFKQFIKLLSHYQDQKVLEESLSILNVLLNEGNDLTVEEESDIMHSLSYVDVDNENDKGFISDRLVQEILYLTYKLKTKSKLSQFISTLMAEKMTASQAKKFIKELKKEEVKNIQISDLIKIGFKFKTNVILMNQILNLIYEKVFAGRDQHETKKLFEFLPKIVEDNIDEESISYKCLQIYKIIQRQNPTLKMDPLISRYLGSLLKYKKEIFLPLKREFVTNEQEFLKTLEFGTEFEIYHLLVVDYLVKNGYKTGKENWRTYLSQNLGIKNKRLKQICLRIGCDAEKKLENKETITEKDEMEFLELLPIETLTFRNSVLQKLLAEPTISNSLYVIQNLCHYRQAEELLLTIHRIALKQKEFKLVKQIEKIVKETYTEQFVFEQLKNITKVKHKVVLRGQLYFIWLPVVIKNEQKLKELEKELAEIMGYDSIEIEDKFYVMELMILNNMEKVIKAFLLYLNRQLEVVNSLEEDSMLEGEIIFKEIKYYLKEWAPKFKSNPNLLNPYLTTFLFHLERTSELLFSKLTAFRSEALTTLLFELEKWDFYSDNWRLPYRWIITALEEVNEQNSLFTLDCLELLEMTIENINEKEIPQSAKDRFMKILQKNWSRFESEHFFAIERIIQILWPNHQYPILSSLQPIKQIPELINEQQQFNLKNEYFFESEHPTSLFLENLEMSHFFGLISQEEFVRNVLHLYDKRFNETKRFTEKNVISLMNFIIWLYQYSEEDMEKGLCEMTMAFLSYKSESTVNDISSYNIRKKCIEIISVVSHSINLLKLSIKELLEVYIGEANVMHHLNEIIQTIIESKASYISGMSLETIVESIMIGLVTCEDNELIEEYIDFIEAVCYIEESPYALMFEESMDTLYQILKGEFKMVEKYRKSLVLFVIDILKHYEFVIEDRLLWFLMNKYFVEEEIQTSILDCLLKNIEKEKESSKENKVKLEYENEKLLIRLIMHHNEDQEIIKMAQTILEGSEKTHKIARIQIEEKEIAKEDNKTIEKKTVEPQVSPEQQFLESFSKRNYDHCQKLLPEIRNPFFTVPINDLKNFLSSEKLEQCENLLIFFIKNPTTRNDLLLIQEFYMKKQCVEEIIKIGDGLQWSEDNLDKIRLKEFNQENLTVTLEPTLIEQIIKPTVSSLLSTPNIKPKLVNFLTQLRSYQQQISLLEFYTKCLVNVDNKIIFELISDLNINENLEIMKLNLPYKLRNSFEATTDLIIYHLFAHLINLPFTSTPELENEERYIKDIAPLICEHELSKNIHIAHYFFINIANRLEHRFVSNKILKQLIELANQYFMLFDGQGAMPLKNANFKEAEIIAILGALLFLTKNGENIHVGVAGKVLTEMSDKVQGKDTLKELYEYLLNSKHINKTLSEEAKKPEVSLSPSKTSVLSSSLNKKIEPKNTQQPVVFAKEPPKSEEGAEEKVENKQEEVTEAFQKGKELEEYMSVAPRQMKALAEKQKEKDYMSTIKAPHSTMSSTNAVSVEQSIESTDEEKLIRPKEKSFDERTFYEATETKKSEKNTRQSISEKERRQLLDFIKLKQNDEISIATLKEHAKYISSLLEYDKLSREELEELMKSIDNITSTVNEHHYYVKKLVELEVTFKLIKLYKRKDLIIPSELIPTFGNMFESKLLTLHHAMSCKKERKTIIFDDELTIEFFKLIIKKSLTYKKSRNENIIILEIVNYCIKSIDAYFKQGLLSMLIELIKMDINQEEVLKFFCKIELTKHIIFEIYQRGLLDKFVAVFSNEKITEQAANTVIINKWIRLAGKICTTVAIQEKYIEKHIHELVWEKHNTMLQNDLESKKSIAFFFTYLGKKNHKVFEYIRENKVLEKLLTALSSENSEELYMMFYYLGIENRNGLEYFFRIKYHLHLLENLTLTNKSEEPKVKSKYFYKSLGQIMSSKQHQSLFFKEQTINKLIKEYENKAEPSIYECLLDFIVTLENDKEFEELKKQGFWECLRYLFLYHSLFEYKLSSEATYAYILQIFLVMIKKGRIKEFNTPEIRGKVTLKAEYSINLEGKELALRFITALSIRTKECYITERCIRLLSSLVGFKVTANELDLIEDILDVEGMLENYEFMEFCSEYEVTQNICFRFKTFNERELLSALKILNILGTEPKNNKILREKLFMLAMSMLKEELNKSISSLIIQEWLFKLILVIVSYKESKEASERLDLGKFLLEIIEKILMKDPKDRSKILHEYVAIVETCRLNNMVPLGELEKILEKLNKSKVEKEVGRITEIKQHLKGDLETQSLEILKTMTQGISVKMYKSDGSSSDLILFLTEDKLELNCTVEKGQPIKQKWRLVLNEIYEIESYDNEKQYENSAFYKSGGLFSRPPEKNMCLTAKSKNNEFNIFFNSKEDKNRWKKYIEIAVENSKKILKPFK